MGQMLWSGHSLLHFRVSWRTPDVLLAGHKGHADVCEKIRSFVSGKSSHLEIFLPQGEEWQTFAHGLTSDLEIVFCIILFLHQSHKTLMPMICPILCMHVHCDLTCSTAGRIGLDAATA